MRTLLSRSLSALFATLTILIALAPATAQTSNPTLVDTSAGRWRFGFDLGVTSWGEGAWCDCNSVRAGVQANYESNQGASFGVSMRLQEASLVLINTQVEAAYFPMIYGKRWLGVGAGIGPSMTIADRFDTNQAFEGFNYDWGLRFRPVSGRRNGSRIAFAVGVTTQREFYEQQGRWEQRPVEFNVKHSGVYVSLGLEW